MAIETQILSSLSPNVVVENPVIYVSIRNLYVCRGSSTNQPFYAKQTQFSKKSNERKVI